MTNRRDFLKGAAALPVVAAAKDVQIDEPPCHEWEFLEDVEVGVVIVMTTERKEVTARVIQDTGEFVECKHCGEFYNKIVRKKGFEVTGFTGNYENGVKICDPVGLVVPVGGRNPEVRITCGDMYLEHQVKNLGDERYEIWI